MRLTSFMICDDVRTEINGKLTIVGVYGDYIKIEIPKDSEPKFPIIAVKLCFLFVIKKDPDEEFPDNFTISFIQKNAAWPIVNGTYQKVEESKKDNFTNFNTFATLLNFPSEGEGRINCRIDLKQGEQLLQSLSSESFSIEIIRI